MKIKNKLLILFIINFLIINIFFTNYTKADGELNTINNNTIEKIDSSILQSNYKEVSMYSESGILMDSITGRVLSGKNINEKKYPASTTKILTAILAIENLDLNTPITASRSAVMSIPSGYSNAGIKTGETLTVNDLLNLFLIHSANEIGYIFAEQLSGNVENFATLMNQKASEIGCLNTHFTNPSGIHDKEHYSTAYDMAVIARYCMKNETFRSIVCKPSCSVSATDVSEERYFKNTNDLLISSSKYYYESAIGIKTGFTSQAKNCLISASNKNGLEVITVCLGAQATETGLSGRYVDTKNLFDYAYSNYVLQNVLTQGNVATEVTIKNATKDTKQLPLVIKDSVIALTDLTLNLNDLEPSIVLNENLEAPIAEGDIIGKISYTIDGITYSSDLLAGHTVEKIEILKLILQIILALFIILLLSRLLTDKKNYKNKKNNKKTKIKKSEKNYDYIYKFN